LLLLKRLFKKCRRWRLGRELFRNRIAEHIWQRVIEDVPVIDRLPAEDKHRLRQLSSRFLAHKVLVGEGGMALDDYKRALIASQACLLILNLGLEYYNGWIEIIVYPAAFIVAHQQSDEAGVVHSRNQGLEGEAWGRGPVILSWNDIKPRRGTHRGHGVNVVLHEFAHKLDMLNGSANGMPPLHPSMHPQQWSHDFTAAYERMLHQVKTGHYARIDPYAVESPAEFFAVVTEFFFERPSLLQQELPDVYMRLLEFYRQDPLHI
jgi:Mlc titration factor MtfA (ptsG expression regulator)